METEVKKRKKTVAKTGKKEIILGSKKHVPESVFLKSGEYRELVEDPYNLM